MIEKHPLKEIVEAQKQGIPREIYSVCSANEYVIEAAMKRAILENDYILITVTVDSGIYATLYKLGFNDAAKYLRV